MGRKRKYATVEARNEARSQAIKRRWEGMTAEQRREATRPAWSVAVRTGRPPNAKIEHD